MERREFLQLFAAASVQPLVTGDVAATLRGATTAAKIPKGTVFIISEGPDGKAGLLRRFDWDKRTSVTYPIPLSRPHSIVQDRTDPDVIYVFEVFGSYARVNLRAKENLIVDHKQKKEMSYGHGIQTEAGDLICTLNDSSRGRSLLSLKSAKDLRTIGDLPAECDNAHHVVLLPKSRLGACGVGSGSKSGDRGAVTFFDWQTRKVVNRIALPDAVIHVFPISGDEVIAFETKVGEAPHRPEYDKSSKQNGLAENDVRRYQPASIHYVKADGTHREFLNGGMHDFFRFNFSFAKIPNTELLITTHLASDRVIIWEKERVKKVIELPFPTNVKVSEDGSEFMVVTAGKVKIFSVAGFTEVMTIADEYRAVGVSTYKA